MVSIIVLVHDALRHNLALFRHNPTEGVEAEWIVVDNASAKPTADFLRHLPSVRVVRSETNLYFASGNNLVAEFATGIFSRTSRRFGFVRQSPDRRVLSTR